MQTGPTGGTEYIYTPTKVDPLPAEEIQKIEEELKKANLTENQKNLLLSKKDIGKEKKQSEVSEPLPC